MHPTPGAPPGPRVVLFGPPGALTSETAAALGDLTGAPVLDTDHLVAAAAGEPAGDVLINRGEPLFRDLERRAAADALATPGAVVALGGGAPLDPGTAATLTALAAAGTPVVELGVSIAQAARRLRLSLSVPTSLINPRAQWLRLQQAREPAYAAVRTVLVSTDTHTPAEVATRVQALLTSLG